MHVIMNATTKKTSHISTALLGARNAVNKRQKLVAGRHKVGLTLYRIPRHRRRTLPTPQCKWSRFPHVRTQGTRQAIVDEQRPIDEHAILDERMRNREGNKRDGDTETGGGEGGTHLPETQERARAMQMSRTACEHASPRFQSA